MIAPATFDVVCKSGQYFTTSNGEVCGGAFHNRDLALSAMQRLEHEAGLQSRTCMTCDAKFQSEGAHHRMCDNCRRRSFYDGAA